MSDNRYADLALRALFVLVVSGFMAGCGAKSVKADKVDGSKIPAVTSETRSVAPCRIFYSDSDPIEFEECVESVTSDGTLILKPSTMKIVESQLVKEKKLAGARHLWMMLAKEKSPNVVFGGPIVAYVGQGPSGVHLARQVAFFDNGPDYFSEGLARSISKSGKVGFLDESLVTVIREEYDFATPYRRGLALACNGCRTEDLQSEHLSVVGGDWLVLNKFGKVLKGPGLSQEEAYEAIDRLTRKSVATPNLPSNLTAPPAPQEPHP